jgi:hypothetical protein
VFSVCDDEHDAAFGKVDVLNTLVAIRPVAYELEAQRLEDEVQAGVGPHATGGSMTSGNFRRG